MSWTEQSSAKRRTAASGSTFVFGRKRKRPTSRVAAQKRIVEVMSRRVDLDIAQISSRALVPPSEVKKTLARMEKAGFIERLGTENDETARFKLASSNRAAHSTRRA